MWIINQQNKYIFMPISIVIYILFHLHRYKQTKCDNCSVICFLSHRHFKMIYILYSKIVYTKIIFQFYFVDAVFRNSFGLQMWAIDIPYKNKSNIFMINITTMHFVLGSNCCYLCFVSFFDIARIFIYAIPL